MDERLFEAYQSDRYENQIRWYDAKAGRCRRLYHALQWPLLVFSTVTPILVETGYHIALFGKPLGLATFTSIVVAIASGALNLFRYYENWLSYRTSCELLRREKYWLDAEIGGYHEAPDKRALFVERIESLISNENAVWLKSHQSQSPTGAKRDPSSP